MPANASESENSARFVSASPFVSHPYDEILRTRNLSSEKYPESRHDKLNNRFKEIKDIATSRIVYKSDNLKITGIHMQPENTKPKSLPLLIFNRGGHSEFHQLDLPTVLLALMPLMRDMPCILMASNNRGNDGGEGKEDLGGEDVKDTHALIDLGKKNPVWNGDIFMYAISFGGMRAYKVAAQREDMSAVAVDASPPDMFAMAKDPGIAKHIFSDLIPGYQDPEIRERALHERSAIRWAGDLKAPLLILHGAQDRHVDVQPVREMDALLTKLGKEHKYKEFPGGDHHSWDYTDEIRKEVIDYFNAHRKRDVAAQEPVPNVMQGSKNTPKATMQESQLQISLFRQPWKDKTSENPQRLEGTTVRNDDGYIYIDTGKNGDSSLNHRFRRDIYSVEGLGDGKTVFMIDANESGKITNIQPHPLAQSQRAIYDNVRNNGSYGTNGILQALWFKPDENDFTKYHVREFTGGRGSFGPNMGAELGLISNEEMSDHLHMKINEQMGGLGKDEFVLATALLRRDNGRLDASYKQREDRSWGKNNWEIWRPTTQATSSEVAVAPIVQSPGAPWPSTQETVIGQSASHLEALRASGSQPPSPLPRSRSSSPGPSLQPPTLPPEPTNQR